MSWSVFVQGKVEEVRESAKQQFKIPLREVFVGLSDPGERNTVERAAELVDHVLGSMGSGHAVKVEASGHIGKHESGPYQYVKVEIQPIF